MELEATVAGSVLDIPDEASVLSPVVTVLLVKLSDVVPDASIVELESEELPADEKLGMLDEDEAAVDVTSSDEDSKLIEV